MKTVEKEKLCINCEGRIALEADVCPYCASEQLEVPKEQNRFNAPIFQTQSLQDSLASLYTPPYQGKKPQFTTNLRKTVNEEIEEMKETLSYAKEKISPIQNESLFDEPTQQSEAEPKSSFWPLLLLITGVNSALVGLMQLFFSKNGILSLEWDAHYWFIYLLIGAPLLFFGYKKFKEFN